METTLTIASSDDVIVFTGTDIDGGFIYDDEALSGWYKLPEVTAKFNKRPNSHGAYSPDQLFANEARIPIPGRYFGNSYADAAQARDRIGAMFNDGKAVSVTVADEIGTTSRLGHIVAFEPEWKPDGHFTFELEFAAPDPRRYGTVTDASTGLPTGSSGLVWPLGTTPGVFWDWGTVGASGRVTVTNDGNTPTYPVAYVGEDGSLPDGFALVEVETGRELRYTVDTASGVVRLDSRTHRATINGGDVTRNMTRKEWFSVPPKTSRQYQFITLGGSTGAPKARIIVADAYL